MREGRRLEWAILLFTGMAVIVGAQAIPPRSDGTPWWLALAVAAAAVTIPIAVLGIAFDPFLRLGHYEILRRRRHRERRLKQYLRKRERFDALIGKDTDGSATLILDLAAGAATEGLVCELRTPNGIAISSPPFVTTRDEIASQKRLVALSRFPQDFQPAQSLPLVAGRYRASWHMGGEVVRSDRFSVEASSGTVVRTRWWRLRKWWAELSAHAAELRRQQS